MLPLLCVPFVITKCTDEPNRPCQALYPSEVLAYNARAKGLAMNGLWLNIVAFINTYAAPVGITNAGWKFYLLYLFVDVLGIGKSSSYLPISRSSLCACRIELIFPPSQLSSTSVSWKPKEDRWRRLMKSLRILTLSRLV